MCSARGPLEGEALRPAHARGPRPSRYRGWSRCGRDRDDWRRTNVYSRAQQLGSDEMSQIVKAHATYASLPAQTFPSAAYQFRSPWLPSLAVVREDQVFRHEASTDGAGDLMRARRRRLLSAPTASSVIDTRRTRPVLVDLKMMPVFLVAETDRSMRTVASLRSTSAQRSAQISPRRAPVATAIWSQVARLGSAAAAAASKFRTTGMAGGLTVARGTSGLVATDTGLRVNHPQRTAWATARCKTT